MTMVEEHADGGEKIQKIWSGLQRTKPKVNIKGLNWNASNLASSIRNPVKNDDGGLYKMISEKKYCKKNV